MRGRATALKALVLSATGIVVTTLLGFAAPSEVLPKGWEATVVHRLTVKYPSRQFSLAIYVLQLGSEHAAIMAALGLTIPLLLLGRRRWGACVLGGILAGAVGAELAKHMVGRRIGYAHVLAYPSGHTVGATTVGVSIALLVRAAVESTRVRAAAWMAGLTFGMAVGCATIMTQNHFPADVFAGFAFGIFVPLLVWAVSDLLRSPGP